MRKLVGQTQLLKRITCMQALSITQDLDSTKIRKDTSLLLGTRLAYLLNSRRVPGVQKGVGQAFAHAQLNNGVSFPGLENDEVRTLKSSKRLRHGHSTGLGFILCPYRD